MRPSSSNSLYAIGTDDWFGIVIMRIQRPSRRSVLTTLNDCEPPHTCITASVRPWLGPHGALLQRNPVDLVFHHAGDRAMALGAAPDLAFRPQAQVAQLDAPSGGLRHAAHHRQGHRIEDFHLGAEVLEDARRLVGQKAAERAFAQRAVQQQDARRMIACRPPARACRWSACPAARAGYSAGSGWCRSWRYLS